jgi:RimJ/RimL family protein N-acetyltransferase
VPDRAFTALRTDRLVVRRFRPADLPTFVAYRSDPAVARYQSWDSPYPMDAAERLQSTMDGLDPDTAGEWYQFAIATRDTDTLIGDCAACTRTDEPRTATIGYTLATAAQGQGYATEAVGRLLDYLFVDRDLHRITASCDERNTRSAALLERVGMRREGRLVRSTWSKGEWCDILLYAVLRDEWPPGRMSV